MGFIWPTDHIQPAHHPCPECMRSQYNTVALNEPRSASTYSAFWQVSKKQIKEANSGPPKNVGLSLLQVNQMLELDYNAGHCG